MEKIISHRGNLNGIDIENENTLESVDRAIESGFDVEIDIWAENTDTQPIFWLGHDAPLNIVDISWLYDRINFLWIHCKNLDALSFFSFYEAGFNYFWHQCDDYTLSSHGYTIAYPGLKPHRKTVMVHMNDYLISENYINTAYGIITDTPLLFKNILKHNKL